MITVNLIYAEKLITSTIFNLIYYKMYERAEKKTKAYQRV